MYLLKVCTVVCLFGILHEVRGQFTEELLTACQKTESGIMKSTLRTGTCYSNINMFCVADESNKAPDGWEFDIEAIHPEFNTEGSNIVIEGHDHTAKRLSQYTVAIAPGISLYTVVELCKKNGSFQEGLVRIVNAYESAAFTIVSRFCTLSIELIKENRFDLMETARRDFIDLMDLYVRDKLAQFHIESEPIRRVIAAINTVSVVDEKRSRRFVFYNDVCEEFSRRFGTMFGFVKVDHRRPEDLPDPLSVHEELLWNIKITQELFKSPPE